MKHIVQILLMFLIAPMVESQTNPDTLFFEREKELFEYAFQNTDLINNTSGLFLDYLQNPDSILLLLKELKSVDIKSSFGYKVASLLGKIDITEKFNAKELIYPFYDHLHSLDYQRKQLIPLMIFDTELTQLNSISKTTVANWSSTSPMPPFSSSNMETENYFFATPFLDSIVYDNVDLHFDTSKVRSNRTRILQSIVIDVNGTSFTIYENDELNLSQFTGENQFTFNYHFDDGSVETMMQSIHISSKQYLPKEIDTVSLSLFGSSILDGGELTIDGNYSNIGISNPSVKFLISDGCNDGLLKKPYFLVAGWGPHTDKNLINNPQNWPSTIADFINLANSEGFVQNLVNAGYDIVFVKFYPPNASIHKNSALLEKMINYVNTRKMNDGSYEENIIHGYSAGALCAKFTLQRMEKKHLEQNGPHPHTKLFVSFDGENQGANIPLGVQHMVDYLDEYEQMISIPFVTAAYLEQFENYYAIYALKYIVDAPLTKELLYYFYTETGSVYNQPSQGHHPLRTFYLTEQENDHHSMNTHIPDYPSFCRNISISNGSSTPDIDMSTFMSNHYPYPSETNATIFYQLGWTKKIEAKFLTHGYGTPFFYGKKGFFSGGAWNIKMHAITLDPLVLDNSPGGIIPIESNPLTSINALMDSEISGSPDISNDHLFSFTPTIFTHDIRNFNVYANGGLGYLNYNFKDEGLNYDNEFDANIGPSEASNTIGYPHLGHPINHYSVTPFDALFTWNENTVHVTSGRKSQSYYEEEWSPARGVIKNFIVEEGEHWNIFLQNKDIGSYTNGMITYRVDYNADYDILFGKHVTQKTDFKPVTIVDNTIVKSMAGHAIYVKDGFHAKPGCQWHAFIGFENCSSGYGGGGKSLISTDTNLVNNSIQQSKSGEYKVLLVPNPASNRLRINIENDMLGEFFDFYIYNYNGILVQNGSADEQVNIQLTIEPGIYIVKLKVENTWYTEKLIIK